MQIALPDARQGAVGAAQQEGAHVGPGEAAVVGRVGRRHLALEPGEQLERLRARVAPVAPVGLVPGSEGSKIRESWFWVYKGLPGDNIVNFN